jgi:hypothetical protein
MNLKELFKILDLDISHLDPKLLSIQILYFYFIIKNWFIKDLIVKPSRDLINYKDSIYKINDLSELQYMLSSYIALIEKVSNVIRNEKCIEYIKYLKLNDTYFYSIYITTLNNIYVIFIYHYYKKVLLIDINTLDITEFETVEESIEKLDIYEYQFLRIIHRI